MKSSKVSKDQYVRGRDNPYYRGLLKSFSKGSGKQAPSSVDQSNANNGQDSQSISEIIDKEQNKLDSDTSTYVMDSTSDDTTVSESLLEPLGKSSVETLSQFAKRNSFSFPTSEPDLTSDVNDLGKESSVWGMSPEIKKPTSGKSYSIQKRESALSKIPLPQSAASFYNGFSPQMEILESCEGIDWLNQYLKARKDDVSSGVPGKFLHVVLGHNVSGLGSIVSTITFAFYLHMTNENDLLCTVPVINMKRADLKSNAEIKWLLNSCQIDLSSLIFKDEIDLSYYDLFGSLKIVLVNSHKLPVKQEALKRSVVEIFNCSKGESTYPWVETVTIQEDCSSCTVVAEKFAMTSPEILAGQRFSRLLLAGILVDTGNLTSMHCTSKDKYISTLLINGAGRFGCDGLYQILRYKMYDVSDLNIVDILLKDFRKWTRVGKSENAASRLIVSHIGMSSIGISIEQLLTQESASPHEIKYFRQLEKVRLLMIVSGYYASDNNFKREILISSESGELMKSMLSFLSLNASELPLTVMHQPGLTEEMRAFEIDKITSRKTIERLLEEFGGISKPHGAGFVPD